MFTTIYFFFFFNDTATTEIYTLSLHDALPISANVWLYDREAEWTIGVQGGYQVPGDWPWPKFKRGQWIVKNVGDYGYGRSEEHTSELQSQSNLVCRLLLEKKKKKITDNRRPYV